jgi:hypothetical protein
MARKRMIDPSIWQDEGMAELTPRQQLLYIGLISNADDDGRLKGSESALRLALPTLYAGVGLPDIATDLNAVLAAFGQLIRYQAGGRTYLAFLNYRDWQKIDKPSPSRLPAPPDQREDSGNASRILDDISTSVPAQENRIEEKVEEEKAIAAADAPRQEASSLRPVPKPKDLPTPRNEQWDALIEGTGLAPQTATERGLLGKMARELRDAGKSGPDILAACENYRERWPDVDLTWTSIVKHFSLNEHPPPVRALPSRESLGRPAGVMSQDFIEQMKRSRQRGDSA